MAKIHILQGSPNSNIFQAVIHTTTPAGNNSAGVAWSTALQNAGLATTILPTGTGAGQITQSELNNIQNGSMFEATTIYEDDPSRSSADRLADLDLRATIAVNQKIADLQQQLKYFGLTRN